MNCLDDYNPGFEDDCQTNQWFVLQERQAVALEKIAQLLEQSLRKIDNF
ncbi:MAG: hypothetical protein QNJ53_24455 [Pleurocapsa sp. MO_192.B19]|nr:hypothetical protein [Pleurocapsa sp. MO_192.B19]